MKCPHPDCEAVICLHNSHDKPSHWVPRNEDKNTAYCKNGGHRIQNFLTEEILDGEPLRLPDEFYGAYPGMRWFEQEINRIPSSPAAVQQRGHHIREIMKHYERWVRERGGAKKQVANPIMSETV